MLRRGQEVVEAVLLVGEAAAVVPFLAVFAAAADVRDRKHPALFDPRQPRGRESGGDGDVEPAIAVEDRRLRPGGQLLAADHDHRSEEHTSELQSLMRNSYAVFCLKKTKNNKNTTIRITSNQTLQ